MKITSIALLTTLAFTSRLHSQDKGIQFVNNLSWNQVKEKAQNENKYIFIDVYATWCGPCKMMDAQVYPTEAVGSLLNKKFVSIRLQQDKTVNDNEYVRSWYNDAASIIKEYRVEGLPTFLFLSPDGKLVNRGLGFNNVDAFTKMASLALTDPLEKLTLQLSEYKNGRKDYINMPELIRNTRDLKKDEVLAAELSKDYKENYLDKLTESELLNKTYLDFIGDHSSLIHSKDKFFKLCYEQPAKVDTVKQDQGKGWAGFQVNQTINREEIEPKLWKGNQPISKSPDWNVLYNVVKKKYPRIDVKKLILDNQVNFYGRLQNFKEFAKYRDLQIKSYPPPKANLSDSWGLNVHAWMLFENSNDKNLLNKALDWSNLSIELDKEAAEKQKGEVNVQLYDTKANLLYKLGRVNEAISIEKQALDLANQGARKLGKEKSYFHDSYTAIIEKMQKGEPTWPTNN